MTNTTNSPVSKEQFLNGLTATQRANSLAIFNQIYVCHELTSREENILYLTYLWKNDFVLEGPSGLKDFHPAVMDVTLTDFELTIELPVGDEGGMNLDITYDFYGIEDLIKMV